LTRVRNNQPLSRAELAELDELEKKMDDRRQKIDDKKKGTASRAEIATSEIIETQAAAALFVGRNARTIRRWEKEGMLTAARNGKKVYIRSQLLLFSQHEGKQPTKTRTRKDEGVADLTQTKAELAKLELEEKQGKLISREEVEKKNVSKILTVKRTLLGQGRKLAMQLAAETNPRKIQALLDRENRAIIEGFGR